MARIAWQKDMQLARQFLRRISGLLFTASQRFNVHESIEVNLPSHISITSSSTKFITFDSELLGGGYFATGVSIVLSLARATCLSSAAKQLDTRVCRNRKPSVPYRAEFVNIP